MIDPEIGFTSDVIKDSSRFVGRTDSIRDCVKALNTPLGLLAIYGKRGVGKSSLLRQVQQMAVGDYTIAKKAGIFHEVHRKPRTYVTVFYTCDSMIQDGTDLLKRLCNDQHEQDGLLRLVPNDGKDLIEFSRTGELSGAFDLKVVNWGTKGIESSKYARTVPGDTVQTFRNYVQSVILHTVKKKMGRDGLLILLDEFDIISNKHGLGSLIKTLSSDNLKFGICGIGRDLSDLVEDHNSIERLLEEGAINVKSMPDAEIEDIFKTAEHLYKHKIRFADPVVEEIARMSGGFPYLAQLIGKECVNVLSRQGGAKVDNGILNEVKADIKEGRAFPTLESQYQKAIGSSTGRQILLHFLAEQEDATDLSDQERGKVLLKSLRDDAEDLEIEHLDQLIPRLVDKAYGPVLFKHSERQGTYEFVNPVLRLYIRLRNF
jgi:Cdc6-like AAA superfamily ATPase